MYLLGKSVKIMLYVLLKCLIVANTFLLLRSCISRMEYLRKQLVVLKRLFVNLSNTLGGPESGMQAI